MNRLAKAALTVLGTAAAGWTLVQNRQLVITELTVHLPQLPPSFEGKRILHLSDLHKKRYGEGFNNLINSCAFLEPDLIFFTGDLFSRDEQNLTPKLVLMQRLLRLAPVYYIYGNHEQQAPDKAAALACAIEKEGVTVLDNRTVRLTADDGHINITGVTLPDEHYRRKNGSFRNLTKVTAETMRSLVGEPESGAVDILLAHDPLPFEAYAEWGADLVFAGHVHGGIIRLPIVGGLLSPERKFFPKYTRGLYRIGCSQEIVSAGLGKFRLRNPSQIILVTLARD